MKKEKLLKLVMIIIMGIVLLATSVEVFGLSDPDDGFNFFEDQSDQLDLDSTEPEEKEPEEKPVVKPTPTPTPNTTPTNNTTYDTNLPKAGVAENTLAGVAITVLAITAIFAYRKVNEYKNI